MSFSCVFPIICMHFPWTHSFASINGFASCPCGWRHTVSVTVIPYVSLLPQQNVDRNKKQLKPNHFQVFFHSTLRRQWLRRIRCDALMSVCVFFRLQFEFPISHFGYGLSFIFLWRPHSVDLCAHTHRHRHIFAFCTKTILKFKPHAPDLNWTESYKILDPALVSRCRRRRRRHHHRCCRRRRCSHCGTNSTNGCAFSIHFSVADSPLS